MSAMTGTAKAMEKDLSEEDVIAFLRERKDFFLAHPDLLEEMDAPGEKLGKGVVSFQQALVDRLKADKSNASRIQKELIDTFRANMSNQNRIQTAVLVLLEAESFEEFITSITQDFPILLDVDTVNIIIESTSKEIPFINQSGIRFARQGFVSQWLGTGDALLQPNINGHEDIFGPGAGLVKSHALLRMEISQNTPAGIIAFGSRDPEAFHPEQAIDQIGFLAQVVERCFRIWLDVQS
ncbi:MAG: DUF484 family protein [Alphaproteobacteria bacterium]|nr:DUF484 family protein [Alphaproteobacteria bacterium]